MIAGRLRKADQFLDAAETIGEFADDEHEVGDALVTLCVHAGIAAADVLCCIALGEHAQEEDHDEALDPARARPTRGHRDREVAAPTPGPEDARRLQPRPVTGEDRKRAYRHADKLVRAARDRRARR